VFLLRGTGWVFKLVGFYSRDRVFLLRGTGWVFKLVGFYNLDRVFTARYGLGL